MCIMIVQNLKIALLDNFAPWAVKVCCPCRAQGKKAYHPTLNVIISQSMWSTSAELYGHIPVVV
jgi:hypothetical protein